MILDAIERGELEASAPQVAYISGAVPALEALSEG